MVRKIIWTHKAVEERKAIFTYWIQRNQSKLFSIKLNNLFTAKVNYLALQPFSGRKTGDYLKSNLARG
jgi:toxin YoeB